MSTIYSVRTLQIEQSKLGLGWVSSVSKTAQQIVPVAAPQKLHQVLGRGFLDV